MIILIMLCCRSWARLLRYARNDGTLPAKTMLESPRNPLYFHTFKPYPNNPKELQYIEYRYIIIMIRNFKNKTAQDLYDDTASSYARKLPLPLHAKAVRLFDQINAATKVETLKIPPSNHLEKLKGKLKDYWSIRINTQWRIIFKWEAGYAIDVEITDYH